MFCIEIAQIPIGIDNRYSYVYHLCKEYLVVDVVPEFIVSVSEKEILQEQNGDIRFSKEYCESLCIYRKICNILVRYDAFLLHSAVVSVDNEAFVFAAPSGTGKTTHIQLWLKLFGDRATVVNGDKPIFRFMNGGLWAFGTPWKGKENLGDNIKCPVRAICFLEQGLENHIRILSAEEITKRIFYQVLIPKEEYEFNLFWALLERMVTSIDFYLLQCNQELKAAQLAYEIMRKKYHDKIDN